MEVNTNETKIIIIVNCKQDNEQNNKIKCRGKTVEKVRCRTIVFNKLL